MLRWIVFLDWFAGCLGTSAAGVSLLELALTLASDLPCFDSALLLVFISEDVLEISFFACMPCGAGPDVSVDVICAWTAGKANAIATASARLPFVIFISP